MGTLVDVKLGEEDGIDGLNLIIRCRRRR